MLYVHCHQVNLLVQDSFKATQHGLHALSVLEAVVTFVTASPKRLTSFNSFKDESELSAACSLRPLCPTRWVMRLPALNAFLEHYVVILDWLESLGRDNEMDAITRSKAKTHLLSMEKFDVYFLLRVFQKLLRIVHVEVQKRGIGIGKVRSLMEALFSSLSWSASDHEGTQAFLDACKEYALQIGLQLPSLPRGTGSGSSRMNTTNTHR